MEVKIKKLHPEAVIPSYSKEGDAGLDLTAVDLTVNQDEGTCTYHIGLAVEIPEGYVGYIFPRSSISKMGCRLSNCVGVIDSGYRGELMVKMDVAPIVIVELVADNIENLEFENSNFEAPNPYKKGDRVAQLVIMPYPKVQFVEVEELDSTDRGEGGFGSTGK